MIPGSGRSAGEDISWIILDLVEVGTKSEMKQDPIVLRPCHVLCLLFVCKKKKNCRQRVSLIREMGKGETKENSQRRPNHNDVVIKHSQGPLVLSQGL